MATETTRKLKMMFKTDLGDDKNVTLNYVKNGLTSGAGAAQVKSALQSVVTNQPFADTIDSYVGAQEIVTTATDVQLED